MHLCMYIFVLCRDLSLALIQVARIMQVMRCRCFSCQSAVRWEDVSVHFNCQNYQLHVGLSKLLIDNNKMSSKLVEVAFHYPCSCDVTAAQKYEFEKSDVRPVFFRLVQSYWRK